MPTGVLVIIGFIVLAPFHWRYYLLFYFSIWLLAFCLKKYWPKNVYHYFSALTTIYIVADQMLFYGEIKHPRFESHFLSVALNRITSNGYWLPLLYFPLVSFV
jgi:PiT family inorganic phosphate transporter